MAYWKYCIKYSIRSSIRYSIGYSIWYSMRYCARYPIKYSIRYSIRCIYIYRGFSIRYPLNESLAKLASAKRSSWILDSGFPSLKTFVRNKPPFNWGSSDLGLQMFSLYPYTNPLCIRYPLEVAMGHSIRYFARYSMRKSIGFAGFQKGIL